MFLTNTSCGQRHPGTLSWDTSCGQGRPSTPLEDTSCRLRRPSTPPKQVRLKGVPFRYHEPPRKVFVSMSLLGVPHAPCWSHMLTCWKRPLANRVSHTHTHTSPDKFIQVLGRVVVGSVQTRGFQGYDENKRYRPKRLGMSSEKRKFHDG